jgi:hypothetical protein
MPGYLLRPGPEATEILILSPRGTKAKTALADHPISANGRLSASVTWLSNEGFWCCAAVFCRSGFAAEDFDISDHYLYFVPKNCLIYVLILSKSDSYAQKCVNIAISTNAGKTA